MLQRRWLVAVVMFADLAGYTALTDVHGDEEAMVAVEKFQEVVERAAETHGLHVVKGIGDAFLLTGEAVPQTLAAAREILGDMTSIERSPAVRIGIHQGPVTIRGDDVFGHTVNLAARIATEAEAGQILISPAVLDSIDIADSVTPASIGSRSFRNVSSPVELFDISPEHAFNKFIDPVCRMLISPEAAVGTLQHEGIRLHFCSFACLERFKANHGQSRTRD